MLPKQTIPADMVSGEDRNEIDRQLERLLTHPLFRMSKRLPAFLKYVVNESLIHGEDAPLKERTLGVEIFGRKPDYDTSADPIVRVTASELRKKLAQYYYEDGLHDEIRIELPPGSYLPRFRRLAEIEHTATDSQITVLTHEIPPHKNGDESHPVAEEEISRSLTPVAAEVHEEKHAEPTTAPAAPATRKRMRLAVPVLLSLLALSLAGYFPLLRLHRATQLDKFWSSFANGSSSSVQIVMPVITRGGPVDPSSKPSDISVAPNLSIEDATSASRVAAKLEKLGLNYRLIPSSEISFEDMRTGPAVLIGALDNVWTARLGKELPFIFKESADGRTAQIVEQNTQNPRSWDIDIATPHTRFEHDFGVVARYKSQLTGEPVIILAGISSQGTQAAGEVLTIPANLEDALKATGNAKNFELVIETDAIDGRAGPPRIVAQKTW